MTPFTRIEVFKGAGLVRRWYFRARAKNGETIAQSEGYVSKWNATRAARRAFPGSKIEERRGK